MIIIWIIIILLVYVKFPYTIYVPGGAIDTSKRLVVEDGYESSGSFNMAYVKSIRSNIIFLLLANVFDKWDIEKNNDVTLPNETYKEMEKRSILDLKEANDTAMIVALNLANKDVTINKEKVIITYLTNESQTNLNLYDEIIAVNDNKIISALDFKNYISSLNNGDKINIKVLRNKKEINCYAYIYEENDTKLVGIIFAKDYDYDTDVDLKIKTKRNESGPSGGLMMTLTLYDKLTKNDLTKGLKIIGTGTIDIAGNVGAIGGVKYKMLGAEKEDCDVFLIPYDNYEEALKIKKEYNLNFRLISVKTADDAIAQLNKL